MKKFEDLIAIADRLLGENGCPWDKKQTLSTLKPYILEETYELLEALDENNLEAIVEEAGDVLFEVVFVAKLGEKDKKFTIGDIITTISEKLIRRHPHIFADEVAHTPEQVLHRWEQIKKIEKNRTSELEGIPKNLPSVALAQKLLKKMVKKELALLEGVVKSSEEGIREKVNQLLLEAVVSEVDLESVVRKECHRLEKAIQEKEKLKDKD